MPISITIAPILIHRLLIMSVFPIADISISALLMCCFKFFSYTVANGNGASGQHEFQRHGATDQVGAPDDNRMLTGNVYFGVVDESHDSARCAGLSTGYRRPKRPKLMGLKPSTSFSAEIVSEKSSGLR